MVLLAYALGAYSAFKSNFIGLELIELFCPIIDELNTDKIKRKE